MAKHHGDTNKKGVVDRRLRPMLQSLEELPEVKNYKVLGSGGHGSSKRQIIDIKPAFYGNVQVGYLVRGGCNGNAATIQVFPNGHSMEELYNSLSKLKDKYS
ncbi:MAG: hypothetical protein V1837_07960 [Candidatus Woesearchaeota archaeon]